MSFNETSDSQSFQVKTLPSSHGMFTFGDPPQAVVDFLCGLEVTVHTLVKALVKHGNLTEDNARSRVSTQLYHLSCSLTSMSSTLNEEPKSQSLGTPWDTGWIFGKVETSAATRFKSSAIYAAWQPKKVVSATVTKIEPDANLTQEQAPVKLELKPEPATKPVTELTSEPTNSVPTTESNWWKGKRFFKPGKGRRVYWTVGYALHFGNTLVLMPVNKVKGRDPIHVSLETLQTEWVSA